MKKIFCLMMALVMVLSIMPISAFAGIADNNPPYSTGMDDTGFYFLRVPQTQKLLTKNSSGTVGWASSSIAKNSRGEYANGYGAGHFVVERNGEYFIDAHKEWYGKRDEEITINNALNVQFCVSQTDLLDFLADHLIKKIKNFSDKSGKFFLFPYLQIDIFKVQYKMIK